MTESYWAMMQTAISENREIVKQNKKEMAARGYSFWKNVLPSDVRLKGLSFDDNIEIQAGTKTILGEDFSNLYASSSVESISVSSDGSKMDIVQPSGAYPTEMHSGNLKMGNWSEYGAVPFEKKAAYEVTLLTKKYANMPDSAENAKNYAETMANYRRCCETSGVDWEKIVYAVSSELQTEVADYKSIADDNASKRPDVSKFARFSKAQAADAHNMLLQCAPENYKDELLLSLSGKITYEDTIDATYDGEAVKAVNPDVNMRDFFVNKNRTFLDVIRVSFLTICEKLPHPIEWAKSVFANMKREGEYIVDNTKGLMEEWDRDSDARIHETREIGEQLDGIKNDIGDSTIGQKADEINENMKREVQDIWSDPSQEIQDARDWVSDKVEKVEPYLDAAGNALKDAGGKLKDKADDFVDKWAEKDAQSQLDSEQYIP